MARGSLQKHNWLQNKLLERPSIIGVNDKIIARQKEYQLMHNDHLFVVPDLYFLAEGGTKYLAEIKSGDSPMLFSKGMNQLERVLYWHEHNGLEVPDNRLVMFGDSGTYWHNDIQHPIIYRLGDSYDAKLHLVYEKQK